MKELLKDIVYTGVGAAFLTRDKLEELRGELMDKGNLSKEEGKEVIDELLKKSDSARDQLELWITRQVEDRIKQLNLATRDEVAELRRMVEELQIVINKNNGDDVGNG